MKYYVVDAFAEKLFEGNPAGVCVLDVWLSDEMMQNIAMENNLSETAFTCKENGKYRLRWFTPGGEIDLCGHATLATAFVLANFVEPNITIFEFETLSGVLRVERKENMYEMDFPSFEMTSIPVTEAMKEAVGYPIVEAWLGRDLVCVLEDENYVHAANPDLEKVKTLKGLLLHISAKGSLYDCVTRSYAPKLGVSEDPVCGSGHCHIAPLWISKLRKDQLVARQASKRGGTLYCKMNKDRITLCGHAVLYSIAELFVD
ncbi:MAG: PhzF family phenazine biosynthesis protein [Bacteroidia bacterium]|nr:PhzF family phenazine biosynthesis protein [Bacteroidia bacterium]